MPQIKVIRQETQTTGEVTDTYLGAASSLDGALTYSAQCVVDVDTPSNKTFASTAVDVATDRITITAHGYTTGLKVQISNPGVLPTGVSASTDYFIIVIDANTVQLATSLANAEAGTALNITAQGSGTNTVNVTALAGASVILQKSNDATDVSPSNWSDEGSATNITTDGNIFFEKINPSANWMRLKFVITAGRFSSSNTIVVKGPN